MMQLVEALQSHFSGGVYPQVHRKKRIHGPALHVEVQPQQVIYS